jgi:hypothetical protein
MPGDGGDPGGPRRLHQDPGRVGDQLHRGAELIVVDENHLVDQLDDPRKGLGHRICDRERSGDRPLAGHRDRAPGDEALCHGGGAARAHAHDPGLRPSGFEGARDASDQRAVTELDDGGVDRIHRRQLDSDRAGALGDGGVQPVDHQVAALVRGGVLAGGRLGALGHLDLGAERAHAGDLPLGCVGPDEDVGRGASRPGRVGEPLPEVARGRRHPGERGL